jgi:glycosyltransferase involved in cell wall biosynthesis
LRGALEQLARGEKRGTVRVLGHRRDVGSLLAAADFVVLPSKHEGLPFSLLEAMALGLPAVVSDVAGNVEVVAESGVVVPAGDIAGFAAAFGRMAADPAARVARGAQARERVGRAFRADDMRRLTRELYDDVLRSASSSTRPERSSRTPAERPE